MQKSANNRDYLLDNCKVLLILLVVTGHFIGPACEGNVVLRILKWVIVSFHMPAFVFISGYFSKRELSFGACVERLAVPYVVYEIIYYLFYTFVMHKETGLYLLQPKFSLWYLMALFFWRVITPHVKKIPYYGWIAVLAGILIGFSKLPSNFLSIPRILVFYPYYLAGTCCERSVIEKLREKKARVMLAAACIGIIAILAVICLKGNVNMQIFYGRYSYEKLRQGVMEGILWRIGAYGIGFLMTGAMLSLMTEGKTFFSYIGTRTMAIYLFHGLTYCYLEYCTDLLVNVTTFTSTVALLGGCILVTFLFSWKPFSVFTGMVGNVSRMWKSDK